MRVGRSALDEDAIRLIEQHNPDVEFDWTRILKGQDAPPEPKPITQPERRPRPRPREFPPAAPRPAARVASEPSPVTVPVPEPPHTEHSGPELEPGGFALEDAALESERAEGDLEHAAGHLDRAPFELEPAAEPQGPELPAPEPDLERPSKSYPLDESVPGAPLPHEHDRSLEPMTAAQARLGFEGLSRLRARHAEVLARISEKVTDADKRAQLKSDAERLNPDTWVTDAEVTAGLESYETVFESLRGVVGRRRKRRGRPSGGPGAAAQSPQTDGEAPSNEPGEDV